MVRLAFSYFALFLVMLATALAAEDDDCESTTSTSTSATSTKPASSTLATTTKPTLNPTPGNYKCQLVLQGLTNDDRIVSLAQMDVSKYCGGTASAWTQTGSLASPTPKPGSPVQVHSYWSVFTIDPDAPDDCHNIYTSKAGDAAKQACIQPLNQIIAQCPIDGGWTSNSCGTWSINTTCTDSSKCTGV